MNSKLENVSKMNDIYKQSGVSLVEILVTVLIFSVGSLGIVSLQLAGLKYSAGSFARTQVTILSDDMANRLKANRAYALNLQADGGFGNGSPYEIANFTGQVTPATSCATNQCSEEELANQDLTSWLNEVARILPSGQARITVLDTIDGNGLPDRQFNIEFQWRQIANTTNPDDVSDDDQIQSLAYRISI